MKTALWLDLHSVRSHSSVFGWGGRPEAELVRFLHSPDLRRFLGRRLLGGEDNFWEVAARYAGELERHQGRRCRFYSVSTSPAVQGVTLGSDAAVDLWVSTAVPQAVAGTLELKCDNRRDAVLPGRRLHRAHPYGSVPLRRYGNSRSDFAPGIVCRRPRLLLREGWSARALDPAGPHRALRRVREVSKTAGPSAAWTRRQWSTSPLPSRGSSTLRRSSGACGVVQEIDAAAMSVWLSYRHIEGDHCQRHLLARTSTTSVREGRRAHQLLSRRHSLSRSEAARSTGRLSSFR